MEEVNLRDVSEAAPDRLRSKTVYRSSEVVGYVSLQFWHSMNSKAMITYRAFARSFTQLLTPSARRPEKLSKLGIKVRITCKAQRTRCALNVFHLRAARRFLQSIVDLRETKHSSIRDDQDAKGRQRILGFISKVLNKLVQSGCAHRTFVRLASACMTRYKDEQAIIHSSIELLQVSRTALTWATQRANAEAEPCKRCSRRIHDESGEQIKVYHGEHPSLLLTFHDSVCCTCSDHTLLTFTNHTPLGLNEPVDASVLLLHWYTSVECESVLPLFAACVLHLLAMRLQLGSCSPEQRGLCFG